MRRQQKNGDGNGEEKQDQHAEGEIPHRRKRSGLKGLVVHTPTMPAAFPELRRRKGEHEGKKPAMACIWRASPCDWRPALRGRAVVFLMLKPVRRFPAALPPSSAPVSGRCCPAPVAGAFRPRRSRSRRAKALRRAVRKRYQPTVPPCCDRWRPYSERIGRTVMPPSFMQIPSCKFCRV